LVPFLIAPGESAEQIQEMNTELGSLEYSATGSAPIPAFPRERGKEQSDFG
jgi:hypothetical protein